MELIFGELVEEVAREVEEMGEGRGAWREMGGEGDVK